MSAAASPLFHLEHGGARAAVSSKGGHVVSWRPALGEEMLYLSPLAAAHPGRAIRGGVPVIFPQFAGLGALPKHGFARTADWREASPEPGEALVLELADTPATRALWPHAFRLTLGLALGGDQLRSRSACRTQATIRSRLRPPSTRISACRTSNGQRFMGSRPPLPRQDRRRPGSPAGRTAAGARPRRRRVRRCADRVVLRGAAGDRSVEVRKRGFEDLVVWNPGDEGAAAMADLPNDGFRHMLCVEAAQVAQAVTLAPGEQWEGVQELAVLTH